MSVEPAALREPLRRWLVPRLAGADDVSIGDFEKPSGGFSATTLVIPIEVVRGSETCSEQVVLRMETDDPAIYPVQAPGLDVEVDIQFQTMDAIAKSSAVPLAPLLGYEASASVLGNPFFVMGFVGGEVPRENPLYTQQGFFVDASPDQRSCMIEDGLRVLAKIHRIDWHAAGFDWLVAPGTTPGMAAQCEIWESFARRELGDRVHPALDRAFDWLRANTPEDTSTGVCWGDARPGNMIWQDFRCACVTDFENVSVGPPEQDLGWWLMFDRWSHETYGVERLPGEPTREAQREHYAACLGREVGDTLYYELFAAARYAAIVVRVMNRMVARGDLPADQKLWLQNPAATCLDQVLELV